MKDLEESKAHEKAPKTTDPGNPRPSEPTEEATQVSALLLHLLPMRAQCDYNAIDAEGHRETPAISLNSTSIQHQPSASGMADAPDSIAG